MKKITLVLCTLFISFFNHTLVAQWEQIGANITNDPNETSVSLSADGSIVAIGKRNSSKVSIYQNINDTWTQVGADINGQAGDEFGYSVSLSANGSIVAIGAMKINNRTGAVYIYQNINNTWTQVGATLHGQAATDQFGDSVSLSADGSIVAIGASLNDTNGSNSGEVRIYQNINNTWTQVGAPINGTAASDQLGHSVSLSADGSIIAIGAIHAANGKGAVRIYQNINNTWTQVGTDIEGEADEDVFGYSVSLSADGSIVAVGAPQNSGNIGRVSIYQNINNTWTQVGASIDGDATYDLFGLSVSLSADGSLVAIGAPYANNYTGYVRVYQNQNNTWTQVGDTLETDIAYGLSGFSVSLVTGGAAPTIAIAIQGASGNAGEAYTAVYSEPSIVLTSPTNNALFNTNIFTTDTQQLKITGLQDATYTISIYSITGKKIYTKHFTTYTTQYLVNLPKVATGIYIARLDGNSGSKAKKILLQ